MTHLTKLKIKLAIWLFITAIAMFIFCYPAVVNSRFLVIYLIATSFYFISGCVRKCFDIIDDITDEERRILSKSPSKFTEEGPFESLEKNQGNNSSSGVIAEI